jgi:hypothetical protein
MKFEHWNHEGTSSQLTKVGLDALIVTPASHEAVGEGQMRPISRVIGFLGVDKTVARPPLSSEEQDELNSATEESTAEIEPSQSSWAS